MNTNEYLDSLKEVFASQYLKNGNDEQTVRDNMEMVNKIYGENYRRVEKIANLKESGADIDQSEAILAVQLLGLAAKFKKELHC